MLNLSTLASINCDHKHTHLMPIIMGCDPNKICSACVEDEALRISIEDQMDYDQVLEELRDEVLVAFLLGQF